MSHYICIKCHEYIRPKRRGQPTGERTVNHEAKYYRDSKGNIHTFYTKAHAICPTEV